MIKLLCVLKHKWSAWNFSFERYFRSESICAISGNDYIVEKWQKRSCVRCGRTQMREIYP